MRSQTSKDFSMYGTRVTYFSFLNFLDPGMMAQIAARLLRTYKEPVMFSYREVQFYGLPGDSKGRIMGIFTQTCHQMQAAAAFKASQAADVSNFADNGQQIH